MKIEKKNYTFIHHETGLSRWKCSFFLFLICITLYLSVSSTVLRKTSQLTKTCIVNKNRMRHWLLSEVNRHDILDKSLLRAKRRSCNSNFSTECQGLDTEFRLKSSMKRMTSIWCFFIILVSYSTNLPRLTSLYETVTGSLIVPDWSQILGDVMLCTSSVTSSYVTVSRNKF